MKNKYLIQWLNYTKEWDNEAENYVRKNNSKIVFLNDIELLEFCRESDKVDIKVVLLEKDNPVPSLDNLTVEDYKDILYAIEKLQISPILDGVRYRNLYKKLKKLQNGVETNKEQPNIKELIWNFAKDIWENEYGQNVGEVDSPEKTNMLEFFKDYCKQNNLG